MTHKELDQLLEHDTAVAETTPELDQPRKYKVILLNDDYTPMEFVVILLKTFFYMNQQLAEKVMMQIHTKGQGICGLYTRDIAETKVCQVNDYARMHHHPLLCRMEAVRET